MPRCHQRCSHRPWGHCAHALPSPGARFRVPKLNLIAGNPKMNLNQCQTARYTTGGEQQWEPQRLLGTNLRLLGSIASTTPRAQTWTKPPQSSGTPGTRVDTVASFHTWGCSLIWHRFNPVTPSYSAPVSIRVEPARSSFSLKHSPAPSSVRTARQHTSGWWHDRLQHFKDLLGRSEFTLLILCSLRSRQADI